jgi:hypothetical protein
MRGKLLTAGLALLVGLAACDRGPTGPLQPGTFTILLTDAPGDLGSAVVTIDRIYLQAGDDDEGESEGPGRVVLMDEPTTVNLLDLRNKALELVAGKVVPGGTYKQLRLVISGGYIEVEQADGSTKVYASSPQYAAAQGVVATGSLQMPSFAASGLKVVLPGGAQRVDGDQTVLLLDFNVADSFGHEAGQSGKWVMSPVIHATELGLAAGVEFSLALADTVTLPQVGGNQITLADFGVSLDKNGDIITEKFVDRNGTFRVNFFFLDPATPSYNVTFVPPAGVNVTLAPAFPTSVNVTAGGTFRQAFTITHAALQ